MVATSNWKLIPDREPEKRCNYIGAVHFLATRPAMTGLENVVTFR